MEGVTMYSWLVTVVFLASAANNSGGQGARGACGGMRVYQLIFISPHFSCRCISAHHQLHMYTT